MDKAVILGDGLLGSELESISEWDVISRKRTSLDIKNEKSLYTLLDKYQTVVNCIAYTDSYSNEKSKNFDINYIFPIKLSDLCIKEDKKLIHISTEFVYANNIEPPTEEEIPLPDKTWYAYTKLLADEYIRATNNKALICRLLHKPNPFPYSEVWNVKTTGDSVDKIAILVKKLIEKNASGIFNVGTGDKNLTFLSPRAKVIEPPSHVPKDTRMNLEKLNNFLK